MKNDSRSYMMDLIRTNIKPHGHHIYSVMGGETPRFLYTIGLKERIGGELVLGGFDPLPPPQAAGVLNALAQELESGADPEKLSLPFEFTTYTLRPADTSWIRRLLLGAVDFYDNPDLNAWQVVPGKEYSLIDIPDMTTPFSPVTHPVWRWSKEKWSYKFAPDLRVITDIYAIRGFPVTGVIREEEDMWEFYAINATDDDILSFPLASLLGHDPSLAPALNLRPNQGLQRDYDEKRGPGRWTPFTPVPSM